MKIFNLSTMNFSKLIPQLFVTFFLVPALQGQNVGIGTFHPQARFQVVEGSVVFNSPGDIEATPSNPPLSGTGKRLMWYPDKAAFRVGYVFGSSWDKDSIGAYSGGIGKNVKASGNSSFAAGNSVVASGSGSVALGNMTLASGFFSIAAGVSTSATGNHSTAFGSNTSASGDRSTALGNSTYATGDNSTTMGLGTVAASYASVAIGRYNDSITGTNKLFWVATDPLFIIGNGTNSNRSNALMVLKNGNTGIGTNSPSAKLHIDNGSFVGASTGLAIANPANPPVSGAGRRIMWYADKAAFRVGYVESSQWDIQNIGNYSFAGGYNAQAGGQFSVALGNNVSAAGDNSVVLGRNVAASGKGSFTFGDDDPNGNGLRGTISNNLFWARFNGGYYFVSSDAGINDIGVRVLAGGNSWTTISDKNLKENFEPVDGEALLQKIAGIPQYTWNYKGQDPKNFRHYGPMAQDFYEAFGKDEYGTIGCDTLINQHDFIGVNMVAIQALEKRTSELQKELQSALSQLNEAKQLIDNQQKDLEVLKKEQLRNSKSSPKYIE
jgi:hypothetical protein